MNPKKANKNILLILAHPDDEAFGCGGTIIKYSSLGYSVDLICATKGEKGIKGDSRKWHKKGIGYTRVLELRKSAKILGIRKIYFFSYKDKKLARAKNIVERLAYLINKIKPTMVITFDPGGISGHTDHKAISRFATKAVKQARVDPRLFYIQVPPQVVRALGLSKLSYPFKPTWRVNIKRFKQKKLKAIAAHQSQEKSRSRLNSLRRRIKDNFLDYEYFQEVQFQKSICTF